MVFANFLPPPVTNHRNRSSNSHVFFSRPSVDFYVAERRREKNTKIHCQLWWWQWSWLWSCKTTIHFQEQHFPLTIKSPLSKLLCAWVFRQNWTHKSNWQQFPARTTMPSINHPLRADIIFFCHKINTLQNKNYFSFYPFWFKEHNNESGWNNWMATLWSQLQNCCLYAMFHVLSRVVDVDCFWGKLQSYFRLCYTFIVYLYTYKGWCYRLGWLNGYALITIVKLLSLRDVSCTFVSRACWLLLG